MKAVQHLALITLVIVVAACSGNGGRGPDEFGIVPTNPLEMPADFTNLPEPDPALGNRADQNPERDAIAALGGNPSRLDATGVPASEVALVNAATRTGTDPQIRTQLADEDAEFRKRNRPRLLERWTGQSGYFRRYSRQALEARREKQRLQRTGVRTPSVPPDS